MKQVHFTLYGKGGTGKSLAASLIAQYMRYRNHQVVFEKAISPIKQEGNYDYLFNRIVEEDKNFVIDNDPCEFLLLRRYILEADLIGLISQHGKQVVMHVVLTNDPETHSHLELMLAQMPEQVRVVVWLNEFYSEFSDFEQTAVYLKHKDRINQLVLLEKQNTSLSGKDLEKMLAARLTFEEVNVSPDFGILEKYRLHRVKEGVFRQLEEVV
jgi:hypothetical protein